MAKEGDFQTLLVRWFRNNYQELSNLFFHVPNGGTRFIREAIALKNQGVVAGIPDILLLYPSKCGNYGFLGLELKLLKGVQSEQQKKIEKDFIIGRGKYSICRTMQECKEIIEEYLQWKK